MRKVLLLLSCLFLIVSCGNHNDDTIKVGAIVFLTGESSSLGAPLRNGLETAKDYINSMGGIDGKMVELIFEDSQSTAKGTISAYNKLRMNNVAAIITTGDNELRAINEAVKKNPIPIIATACTGGIDNRSKWVLRYCYSEQSQDKDIAEYVYNDLKKNTMAIACPNSLYGQDILKYTKKYYEDLGGQIVTNQFYQVDDTNQRNIALNILKTRPEIVYVRGIGSSFESLIKALRENGYKNDLIGDITIGLPSTIENLKHNLVKSYYVAGELNVNSNEPFIKQYVEDYRGRYKQEPSFWDALGFDSLYYLSKAFDNVNDIYDGECVLNQLYNMQPIHCLLGLQSFDSSGDLNFKTSVFVIDENGVSFVK